MRSSLLSLSALLFAPAEASHCRGTNPPSYCCILACDSSYANKPNYFGVGTTPPCTVPGVPTLSMIFAEASSKGCSPLTEDSCAFGPTIHSKNMCQIETILSAATAVGDPHLNLPHGGRADFRGEDKAIYNFLSAKGLAVNVMTELADFDLHAPNDPRHKHVHGSFLTQAHIVAKTVAGKTVRASYYANVIGPTNRGFVNGTVDSEPAFKLGAHKDKVVDDVTLTLDYSSLHVTTPEFEIIITPINLKEDVHEGIAIGRASGESNVQGMHHRLDVELKLRVPEASLALPPHGIIGQHWDGDGKAIDGEMDKFPHHGEFTTYAMAKGAIEGLPIDYKVASQYATDFKFSRFAATSASPRDVVGLVSTGMLNEPKDVGAADGFVGSTEYNETTLLEL